MESRTNWKRIRSLVRGIQASVSSETKFLAPLVPLTAEALEILDTSPTRDSIANLKYLLTSIQNFVARWRPSKERRPGVFYSAPNWARDADNYSTEALKLLDGQTEYIDEAVKSASRPTSQDCMKVFISHSSVDSACTEALAELLRSSLGLRTTDIRCTSLDGYRLPAGANTDAQIRREVFDCDVFIALLSPNSIKSVYVLFELGARWGTGSYLAPLLISGLKPLALKSPLSGINSVQISSEENIHQFLNELAQKLTTRIEPASAYLKQLKSFLKRATPSPLIIQ